MITIEYYREFVEVANLKSFSAASEQLFISQSSLSKHIALLEKELGVSLFSRNTRNVELSEFGVMILPYVKNLVEMDDRIHQTAQKHFLWKSEQNGQRMLKIVSMPATAAYNITRLISGYYKLHPELSISVKEYEKVSKIPGTLDSGEFELGFVRKNEFIRQHYDCIDFCHEPVVAVLPANHPLAAEKQISLSRLKDEKYIMITEEASLYQIAVNLCLQAGFAPEVTFTSPRMENIISLVAQRRGVSLLSLTFYEYYKTPDVTCVKITPSADTSICLVKSREGALSPEAKAFWNHMANIYTT